MDIKTQQDFLAQMSIYQNALTEENTVINNKICEVSNKIDHLRISISMNKQRKEMVSEQWHLNDLRLRELHKAYVERVAAKQATHDSDTAEVVIAMKNDYMTLTKPEHEISNRLGSELHAIKAKGHELNAQLRQLLIDRRTLEMQRKANGAKYHGLMHELILAHPKGSLPEE